jgi:prenyltransferase beta subunit
MHCGHVWNVDESKVGGWLLRKVKAEEKLEGGSGRQNKDADV